MVSPFPDLEGTWSGTLNSSWINPETQQGITPIPITLTIRQTFSSVSCVLYTKESESYSVAAQINEDDSSGILRLSYNYTNRPKANIRGRSAIHDGAATLQIISTPRRVLEGEYWTSRKTAGEMRLSFTSKKIAEVFQG